MLGSFIITLFSPLALSSPGARTPDLLNDQVAKAPSTSLSVVLVETGIDSKSSTSACSEPSSTALKVMMPSCSAMPTRLNGLAYPPQVVRAGVLSLVSITLPELPGKGSLPDSPLVELPARSISK